MIESIALLLAAVAYELGLFAAVIFALFGVDDLAVDALFLAGVRQDEPVSIDPAATLSRDFALFIPAWAEGDVIGAMLAHCTATWPTPRLAIYVGVYANDLATMLSVGDWVARDARVRMVVNTSPGPTTKGGCLNLIWRRYQADIKAGRQRAGAVILHDAEDVVDPAALALFDGALVDADYVQIPVVPLIDPMVGGGDRWIRRHYADEFAEAHGKEMVVRAAIGAPLPTAGVGCAFRAAALAAVAAYARRDGPFPHDSLTEDYELGLTLAATGARARFVRSFSPDGRLIASRGYFPHRIADAVRQKTRWLRGNALDGWGRTGWLHSPDVSLLGRMGSWWMLWRDRRAVIAAAAVLAGYCAMVFGLTALGLAALMDRPLHIGGAAAWLLVSFNAVLLLWRLALRGWFTARLYGRWQGVMAVLRQPVSNIILVMTAWRAMLGHWRGLRGQAMVWDKTAHQFPDAVPAPLPSPQRIELKP